MKRYIYAMSFPRKTALKHLSKNAEALRDHVIKCVVYKDIRKDDMYHWVHDEICNWLAKASEIKSDSKLKYCDIRETVFGEFGSSTNDAKIILEDFKDDYCYTADPYPEFEITQDLIDKLYITIIKLEEIAIGRLLEQHSYSQEDWYELIKNIF